MLEQLCGQSIQRPPILVQQLSTLALDAFDDLTRFGNCFGVAARWRSLSGKPA
jgi:hypothetical protein